MKTRQTIRIVVAALIISGCALLTPGCATSNIQWTDTTITASVSFGTTEGLKLAIKDPAKRTVIANYINTYSKALRSVSGTPTPDALLTAITQFIPANIRQNYPELQSIVFPVVTSIYGQAYAKFGADNAKIYAVLNDIATGLESGSAPFISRPPQT